MHGCHSKKIYFDIAYIFLATCKKHVQGYDGRQNTFLSPPEPNYLTFIDWRDYVITSVSIP